MSNITLTIIGSTITLPPDLVWQDEFKWTPVATAKAVTLGGSLVIEKSKQLAGRPITLGGLADAAWLLSADMDALQAADEAQGDTAMTLTLADGRTFSVLFDGTGAQPAVQGEQVFWRVGDNSTERNTLQWWLTLRLIQIG